MFSKREIAVGNRRLMKLYKHLTKGKRAHGRFNFAHYDSQDGEKLGCGTSGCMAGELVAVFPKAWEWNRWSVPRLKGANSDWTNDNLDKFFALGKGDAGMLFHPPRMDGLIDDAPWRKAGLSNKPTLRNCANNLKLYVDYRKAMYT